MDHRPVVIDDIISTAHTMIQTVINLKKENSKASVCFGVHALFAGNAYQELKKAGAVKIITADSIQHWSNVIDLAPLFVEYIT